MLIYVATIYTFSKRYKECMTAGICECAPGDDIDRLISLADARLYKGKHSGKNCVVYED